MVVANLRNAQRIVNTKALYENIHNAKQRLNDDTELWLVLKANGYGHGAIAVAKTAEKAGATGFCVALLDEALQLRQAGFRQPILVLGLTDVQDAPIAAQNNVSLTVSSSSWILAANKILSSFKSQPLKIHLALDTGMGRIGFQKASELKDAVSTIKQTDHNIIFEGIFTHFSTADSPDSKYFHEQYDKFEKFMAVLPDKPKYVHVANSATSLWHKVCGGNLIRLGISAYGLNPSGRAIKDTPYTLQPVMSVETELTYSKIVEKGKYIGYGATYQTQSDEWIGTVPMGYADGIPRKMQGFKVLVDGQFCPIVGRVCMDQFMIKLPKEYSAGTKVVIIGESKGQTITADDVADYLGTISYEVICGFSERLKITYL